MNKVRNKESIFFPLLYFFILCYDRKNRNRITTNHLLLSFRFFNEGGCRPNDYLSLTRQSLLSIIVSKPRPLLSVCSIYEQPEFLIPRFPCVPHLFRLRCIQESDKIFSEAKRVLFRSLKINPESNTLRQRY